MTGTAVKCEVERHLTGKETEPWEITGVGSRESDYFMR